MFKLITTDGKARRGEFQTAHGTVQTPVFMNVGTQPNFYRRSSSNASASSSSSDVIFAIATPACTIT